MLRRLMIARVGDIAPDFFADAFHNGAVLNIKLSQYRGQWVVLLFVVGDFTCVCPTEIAAVAVKYPAFHELEAEILVVSADSISIHKEWHEKAMPCMITGGARFPLISDQEGTVGRLYGVFDEAKRIHLRSHFLIDPEGIIQSVEMLASPIGRSVSEMLRQLRAMKEYRATGKFIPCGWEPGKPTISETDDSGVPTRVWESWRPGKAF
jgi:peroxiredoxin (alkyl hydroperoxide reductase subunit C)